MIYFLIIAFFLTTFGFALKVRQKGLLAPTLDLLIAMATGWLAGIFIGIGARIGMSAITYFNGGNPSFSASGSFRVVLFFSSFGIGLGLLYEFLWRDFLHQSGLLYGLLITLCTWYSLAQSAIGLLKFQPTIISLILFTFIFVALLWLPFGLTLEKLLSKWHRRSENFAFVHPLNKLS